MEKLRQYQEAVVTKIQAIYKAHPKAPRAFLQMPTGTGKTFTALHLCLKEFAGKGPVTVAWAAHQTALVEQSYNDFYEMLGQKPPKSQDKQLKVTEGNVTLLFTTWQSLRESETSYDMLIIDEVHCGSSMPFTAGEMAPKDLKKANKEEKKAHKSFEAILKLSDKHLYISATPMKLNPDLFKGMLTPAGNVKAEFVAVYTLSNAQADGYICNTKFKVVQTLETITLRKLDDGSERAFSNSEMQEHANEIKNKKVNIKRGVSRTSLEKSIAYSLLDVVFRQELKKGKLPPTMVFCKVGDGPLSAAVIEKRINEIARRHEMPSGKKLVSRVGCYEKGAQDTLNRFRAGEINILCVTGMAREGFNYKQLEVAVDFNPSFANARLTIQKIGRVVRTYKNEETGYVKQEARYYYADTIDNYLRQNGVRKEPGEAVSAKLDKVIAEQLQGESAETQANAKAALSRSVCNTGYVQKTANENLDESSINFMARIVDSLNEKGKHRKTFIAESGYVISKAENNNAQVVRTSELFSELKTPEGSRDPEGKKNQLLEMARAGKERTLLSSELGCALRCYIKKSSGVLYDSEFKKTIKKIAPGWFAAYELNPTKKKNQLIAIAKSGANRPKGKKHPLGATLSKLTTKGRCHDPKFTKLIKSIRPDWFTKTAEENKRRLLALAKSGKKRPAADASSLGGCLANYITPNPANKSYDSEFTQQLKLAAPTWFEKSSDKNKASLLLLAEKGGKKPTQPNPLGKALGRYVNPNNMGMYDSCFTLQIRKLAPHWFRKRAKQRAAFDSFKMLQEYVNLHKRLPNAGSSDEIEARHYRFMIRSCSSAGPRHNDEIDAWCRKKGYGSGKINKGVESKKLILDFVKKYKRKPMYNANSEEERKLSDRLRYFLEEKRGNDAEFKKQVLALYKKLGL